VVCDGLPDGKLRWPWMGFDGGSASTGEEYVKKNHVIARREGVRVTEGPSRRRKQISASLTDALAKRRPAHL